MKSISIYLFAYFLAIISLVVIVQANKEGSYLSSESPDYLKLIDNDKCKRISVEEKIYRGPMPTNHPDWAPTGSLLPCVYALSFYAEKILAKDSILGDLFLSFCAILIFYHFFFVVK